MNNNWNKYDSGDEDNGEEEIKANIFEHFLQPRQLEKNVLYTLSDLSLTVRLGDRCHCYSHFINKETGLEKIIHSATE